MQILTSAGSFPRRSNAIRFSMMFQIQKMSMATSDLQLDDARMSGQELGPDMIQYVGRIPIRWRWTP